jgi:DNA-binding MarR family transcriptional regulator
MREDNLLHDLGYTARLIQRKLFENLEELGLYHGQQQLLSYLHHHDGSRQRDIGEWLDIRPATLTKMVNRMEKAGFLERKRDPQDKRSMHVYLTKKASDTMRILKHDMKTQEQMALQDFSSDERDCLKDMLARLRENMGVTGHPCRGRHI